MKESLQILVSLFEDFQDKCSTSWSKDMRCIKSRISNEGSSFLTITLPNFSESFFRALEQNQVTSDLFQGWKKRLCLPAFLQGFTSLVFDQHTGRLLDEPNLHSIRAIRQICNVFKKVAESCTEERRTKALRNFVQLDCSLDTYNPRIDNEQIINYQEVGNILFSSLFGEVQDENLVPHHGPGSTFERVKGNRKYSPRSLTWYTCLEPYFQKSMIFNSDESYAASNEDFSTVCHESTVRVITVNKTLKAPRTIAIEPTVMQMAQQSLKDFLVKAIERGSLTAGHVNFRDQSVNQRLALESSKTRKYATLDMKDASDRVTKKAIWLLLSVNPHFRDLVFSTRSSKAYVLGESISLNKFASMGSALCFPMMAMYFYTLVIIGVLKHKGLQPSYENIKSCKKGVYIYGDDIIVPIDVVDSVITTLTNFGNVVSLHKSFWLGSFRESCGVDAYDGCDITPVYMRHKIPQKCGETNQVVSVIETINQFFNKKLYRTALLLKDKVEKLMGKLPFLPDNSSGLGWRFDVGDHSPRKRWNRKLHRLEVQALVPTPIYKKDRIGNYNALAKSLVNLERRGLYTDVYNPVSQDDKTLTHSPVRGALALKRRWVTTN